MSQPHQQLERALGVPGATLLGLGSIVGTGVFVSLALGASVAGPAVIAAVVVAAGLATCNALSSAQLAANHPVSGGTYEYGYILLNPASGFAAGWMFLAAKSASAATAALGFASYLTRFLGVDWPIVPVAVLAVVVVTGLVLSGIRRSAAVNGVIVAVTLAALAAFCIVAAPRAVESAEHFRPFLPEAGGGRAFLEAAALMFVAYTGYGRIATMGEEVREPRRTIPLAIMTTLVVSSLLYAAVAAAAIGAVGADRFASFVDGGAAPLERAAEDLGRPWLAHLVAIGAMTAMLGVLLNLVLGLSRVVLAMARRRDVPGVLARVAPRPGPYLAVIVVGVVIAGLASIGSVKATWSFSAFTVLIYYAITNLASLRLGREQLLYPRVVSVAGLLGCLGLAFWVEPAAWIAGLGLLAVGLVWHAAARRLGRRAGA